MAYYNGVLICFQKLWKTWNNSLMTNDNEVVLCVHVHQGTINKLYNGLLLLWRGYATRSHDHFTFDKSKISKNE